MARFDNSIATALRLISKNGEASTIYRRVDAAPVDPAKPWTPGVATETSYTVRAVWLDAMINRGGSTLIQAGDQLVYVAASGMTITPDPVVDRIERADGASWTVIGVETLNPNGQEIIHVLQVRQ